MSIVVVSLLNRDYKRNWQ